jgi:hypothetical protein
MVLRPDHGEQTQAKGRLLMVSRYRIGRGREWGAEACTERAWRENDEAGCLIVFLLGLDHPGQHH